MITGPLIRRLPERGVRGNSVLEPWWQRFPGPFLYYPGRRLVPAPPRAFIDFIKVSAGAEGPVEV